MNFDEIKTLIAHNQSPADWNIVFQDKVTLAYCLEDVDLRLTTSVVRVNGISRIQIQILYAATIILSFLLPPAKRSAQQIELAQALALAATELRKGAGRR